MLHHLHFDQGDRAVEYRFQVGGHAVAVQRKAPDDQVSVPVYIQNSVLVVRDHAVPVFPLPAAKAAVTGRDLFVDHVDDVYLMLAAAVQAFQKGIRQPEGVALFLGTAVQYKNSHVLFLRFLYGCFITPAASGRAPAIR